MLRSLSVFVQLIRKALTREGAGIHLVEAPVVGREVLDRPHVPLGDSWAVGFAT